MMNRSRRYSAINTSANAGNIRAKAVVEKLCRRSSKACCAAIAIAESDEAMRSRGASRRAAGAPSPENKVRRPTRSDGRSARGLADASRWDSTARRLATMRTPAAARYTFHGEV